MIEGKAGIEIDVIIRIDDYQKAIRATRDDPEQNEMIDYSVYVTNSDGEEEFLQDELLVKHERYLTKVAFEIARGEQNARDIEQAEHKYEASKEEIR